MTYKVLLRNPIVAQQFPMMGPRQVELAKEMMKTRDYVSFNIGSVQSVLRRMNGKGFISRHHKDGCAYKITEKGVQSYIRTCTNRK